ncbi:MAG: hypothetical protein KA732_00555 [Providencia sp.]|uniref:hypothetical protein n=1 Tax=Providencia sp. TaxID=589 RepID=UPI001B561DF4|nr:hypothetical protein [Providencia sp.]MBP6079748.1 hypothetical protein [Providencia sp.]
MSDVLREAVAFERISVIAKLGSLGACNVCDMQVVLEMITEIADEARGKLLKSGTVPNNQDH